MSYQDFSQLLMVTMLAGFALITVLEFAIPASGQRVDPLQWLRHGGKNLALWLFNSVLLRLTVGVSPILAAVWAARNGVGLFNLLEVPLWWGIVLGVILIDFFDYLLHRILHNVRPLWLLHAVHHSDREVDVTTNLRAHPLQVIVIMLWKSTVAMALGLSLWALLIRELLTMPVAQLHHASFRWPARLDRWLSLVIVTPAMHRLHHCPEIVDCNSNYGELFSVWDRLFGTYRDARPSPPYGLYRLQDDEWHSVWGMLKTPFRARRYDQL